MIKWNDEPTDSALFCGCIDGRIKIWPNTKEIGFSGWVGADINAMVEQARRDDEEFRKYRSPIEHITYRTMLFFGVNRLVLHSIKIGNGWTKI